MRRVRNQAVVVVGDLVKVLRTNDAVDDGQRENAEPAL